MFRQARSKAKRLLAVVGSGALLGGCTAVVDGSSRGQPGGSISGAPGSPPTSAGGSGGSSSPPPTSAAAIGPSAGRRLTKPEYLATVSALLGVDLSGRDDAGVLPDDQPPTGAGFRNDIGGLLPTASRTDAYETLATRVAKKVPWSNGLATFATCTDATQVCRSSFVSRLGRVLYRRPLTDAEVQRVVVLFDDADAKVGFEDGARLVLEAMLQSPHFLYRLERLGGVDSVSGLPAPSPFELATRLSYLVWQSAPSPELLDAAEHGGLTGAEYATTVSRLLSGANAVHGFQGFTEDWLQLYRLDTRTPNEGQGVTPALLTEMKQEVSRFTTRVAFTEGQAIKALLTDKKTELGPALAGIYGVPPPAQGFAMLDLAANANRIGILTQPGFMILRAAPERATIVHRGLMVLRLFLCSEVPAPPANAATQADSIPTNLTDRDRFALHAKAPTCAACHSVFDPLGYPFEPFDLAGRFRGQDEFGNALRSDGDVNLDGSLRHYGDTASFANLLAESPSVGRCFVSKVLQYGLGRSLTAQDQSALEGLSTAFQTGGETYAAALTAIASSDAFRAPAPTD